MEPASAEIEYDLVSFEECASSDKMPISSWDRVKTAWTCIGAGTGRLVMVREGEGMIAKMPRSMAPNVLAQAISLENRPDRLFSHQRNVNVHESAMAAIESITLQADKETEHMQELVSTLKQSDTAINELTEKFNDSKMQYDVLARRQRFIQDVIEGKYDQLITAVSAEAPLLALAKDSPANLKEADPFPWLPAESDPSYTYVLKRETIVALLKEREHGSLEAKLAVHPVLKQVLNMAGDDDDYSEYH